MTSPSDSPNGDLGAEVPPILILPAATQRGIDEADLVLGGPGRPFNHRTPFLVGMNASFGVAVAYVIVRGIADITTVIVIIGLALFLAIGLNPIIEFLVARGLLRGIAVSVVTIGFLLIVAVLALSAATPVSHEFHVLVKNYPRYKASVAAGQGWAGQLAVKFHLTGYLKGGSAFHFPFGGVLGASKKLLSLGVATISVVAMTIYFLIALPGVRELWLSVIPRSRRDRVDLLTSEVFSRVGGFMLGNLVTSLISGVGTYLWLIAFSIPYALVLAFAVALFDLIPIVGSTVAGLLVSLVAATKGLPIGIATAGFYVVYRYLEDFFLNPRVMRRTVKVSAGLTIVATLVGGALLGLIGALVAVPAAATLQLLLEEVVIPRQNQR
ncbi:MAG: AI-2E family transporter [Acidobacteria bacterium]|nr:AI-2E family transporter [Acidobacteriota bacterium]